MNLSHSPTSAHSNVLPPSITVLQLLVATLRYMMTRMTSQSAPWWQAAATSSTFSSYRDSQDESTKIQQIQMSRFLFLGLFILGSPLLVFSIYFYLACVQLSGRLAPQLLPDCSFHMSSGRSWLVTVLVLPFMFPMCFSCLLFPKCIKSIWDPISACFIAGCLLLTSFRWWKSSYSYRFYYFRNH